MYIFSRESSRTRYSRWSRYPLDVLEELDGLDALEGIDCVIIEPTGRKKAFSLLRLVLLAAPDAHDEAVRE